MYWIIDHAVLCFLSLPLMGLQATFALADTLTLCTQLPPGLAWFEQQNSKDFSCACRSRAAASVPAEVNETTSVAALPEPENPSHSCPVFCPAAHSCPKLFSCSAQLLEGPLKPAGWALSGIARLKRCRKLKSCVATATAPSPRGTSAQTHASRPSTRVHVPLSPLMQGVSRGRTTAMQVPRALPLSCQRYRGCEGEG